MDFPFSSNFPEFQKTGIKPSKTGRFALTRGFLGLIYALETERPPDQHGGAGLARAEKAAQRRFCGQGKGNMADSREVMNIRQASQYLGVSPDTLYKYVGEQKIPAFKLGNRWRFKKSKLDQWMEEKSSHMETGTKHKPKAATKAAGSQ
jgi:excisionase family DNA binding protein